MLVEMFTEDRSDRAKQELGVVDRPSGCAAILVNCDRLQKRVNRSLDLARQHANTLHLGSIVKRLGADQLGISFAEKALGSVGGQNCRGVGNVLLGALWAILSRVLPAGLCR